MRGRRLVDQIMARKGWKTGNKCKINRRTTGSESVIFFESRGELWRICSGSVSCPCAHCVRDGLVKSNDLHHHSDAGKYVFCSYGPETWRRGVVLEIVEIHRANSAICSVVAHSFIQTGIVGCFRVMQFKTCNQKRGETRESAGHEGKRSNAN